MNRDTEPSPLAEPPTALRTEQSTAPRSTDDRSTADRDDTTPTTRRWRAGRRGGRLLTVAAGTLLAAGAVVSIPGAPAAAIVDGEPTTVTANPWQVALTERGEQFCGGSIISDRVIVTAAHCVVGLDAGSIEVRAGVTSLSEGGQVRGVATVVEHPDYVGASADIAMLVLDRPLQVGASVAPIELATPDELASATTARVTGWGDVSEQGGGTPDVLQSAEVPVVDDDTCDRAVEGIDDISETCAGGTGTDSCYGDSGGPLTIDTERGRVLAGVTSWGLECGGDTPGVYAEVPAFADWLATRVDDPDAPAPERIDVDDLDDEFFEEDDDWSDDDWGDDDWDEPTLFDDGVTWCDAIWDDLDPDSWDDLDETDAWNGESWDDWDDTDDWNDEPWDDWDDNDEWNDESWDDWSADDEW